MTREEELDRCHGDERALQHKRSLRTDEPAPVSALEKYNDDLVRAFREAGLA